MRQKIEDIVFRINSYFVHNKSEIARQNLRNLLCISLVGCICTLAYFIMSPNLSDNWHIGIERVLFLPFFLLSVFAAVMIKIHKITNFYVIQSTVLIFCVCALSIFMLTDIFPDTHEPQAFFNVVVLIIPVIFIFRPIVIYGLVMLEGITFIIMVFQYKSGSILEHDVLTVAVSMIISFFSTVMLNQVRAREYNTHRQLEELCRTDLLTNTYNKVSFDDVCRRIYEVAGATNHNAFLIADIDNFKEINDGYGHQKGDEIIKRIGTSLSQSIRDGDVVGRIGGDEFAVLILNVYDEEQVQFIAERIIHSVKQNTDGTIEGRVTISIGGVMVGKGKYQYNEVFSKADKALYMVKAAGKNNYLITR